MKNRIIYFSILFLVVFFYSCNENDELREREKTKQEGINFLLENTKKEGVVSTKTGLQYKILKAGTGTKPNVNNRVKVHYQGTLINGTVFDSSVKRNEPAVFGVTQVIPGWTEALQLMPVGSKWKLYIPYYLAYGGVQKGVHIKPYSTLIFEIELLAIEN